MKTSLIHLLPKPEKDIFIYALCEPGTENVKYIGLATNGFKRIKQHYNTGGNWTANKRWIRDNKKIGKIFNIIYLEYFDSDGTHLDEAEIFYISYFKFLGFNLLNHTEGGRRDFMTRSLQEITRQTAKNKTQESRKFFSEKTKAQWADPKKRKAILENRHLSRTTEWKERIKKNLSAKVGVKIQDDLGNVYNSGQECADALGVKKPNIYRALKVGFKVKGRTLTKLSGGRSV